MSAAFYWAVAGLTFLATAAVLCLHSRYLYWLGQDLIDTRRALWKAVERMNGSGRNETAEEHPSPDTGIRSKADHD